MNAWLDITLMVFIVLTGLTAAWIADLVGAVLLLGTLSLFLALMWAVVGAPDVAFTEAVAGAGISSVLMLLALFHTVRVAEKPQEGPLHKLELALVVVLGLFLFRASAGLPHFGDPGSMPNRRISTEYIERSVQDTHTPNVVTAVLADYRGLDTLIETTVIFTAGLVCWLLLGFPMKKREDGDAVGTSRPRGPAKGRAP